METGNGVWRWRSGRRSGRGDSRCWHEDCTALWIDSDLSTRGEAKVHVNSKKLKEGYISIQ